MNIAYFDCFAGVAGDMIVGALLSAGADFQALQDALRRLNAGPCRLDAQRAMRGSVAGTRFVVDADSAGEARHGAHAPHEQAHEHRNLASILAMIDSAELAPRAAARARKVFERLGAAEAKVHAIDIAEVHFHEVGAIDSIMDIVGACVAMELLGIDRVCCSPVPPGSGVTRTDHGLLPVPAPATVELLSGVPVAPNGADFECTTPTGAAVMTALAESYGPPPPMTISAVGYGAGSREQGPLPNLLRVVIGRCDTPGQADSVVELSANIDDCTGETLSAAMNALLAAGCLDAWASPIYMKKGRPAWLLCALCAPGDAPAVEHVMFTHTTTFGVRRRTLQRTCLDRRHEQVQTPYGPIRVKVGLLGGRVVTAAPEFADCEQAAQAHHVSVREVMHAASLAFGKTA